MSSTASGCIPSENLPLTHPPPATLPAYTYTALPTPTSIRVVSLVLHAQPPEDAGADALPPLHLRLRTIDLGDLEKANSSPEPPNPSTSKGDPPHPRPDGSSGGPGPSPPESYQALSYTWGSPLTVFSTAEARDADADLHSRTVPVLASNGGPRSFNPQRKEDLDGNGLGVLHIWRNLYDYLRAWEHELRMLTLMLLEKSNDCDDKKSPAVASSAKERAAALRREPLADHERAAVMGAVLAGMLPPQTLWIDAACINQEDVDEKSAQVAMMGRIYGAAEKVIVWLGPVDDFTRPALSLLRTLSSAKNMRPMREGTAENEKAERKTGAEPVTSSESAHIEEVIGGASYGTHADRDAACAALGVPPLTSSRWWAVFAVLSRAWFRRAWIVQEIALAGSNRSADASFRDGPPSRDKRRSSLGIKVQVGPITFDWALLTNAVEVLFRNGMARDMENWAWFEINGPTIMEPLFHVDERTGEVTPIMQYCDRPDSDRKLFVRQTADMVRFGNCCTNIIALDGIRNGDGSRWDDGGTDGGTDGGNFTLADTSVLGLMDECRRTSATDARDKVYAFLSVAARKDFAPSNPSPKRRPLLPSYRLSTARVYTEAAWSFLLATRDLSLLQRVEHIQRPQPQSPRKGNLRFGPCGDAQAGSVDTKNVSSSGGEKDDGDNVSQSNTPAVSYSAVDGLPSWVPDWRVGLRAAVLYGFKEGHWRACGDHRWTLGAEDGAHVDDGLLYGDALPVEGWRVDVVEAVAGVSEHLSLGAAAMVAAELPEVYGWAAGKTLRQRRGEVFWRTLMVDSLWTMYPLDDTTRDLGHVFFEGIWVEEMKRAARECYSLEGLNDPEKQAEWQCVFDAGFLLFAEELEKASGNRVDGSGDEADDVPIEPEPSTVGEGNGMTTSIAGGVDRAGDKTLETTAAETEGQRGSAVNVIDELEQLALEGGKGRLSQIEEVMLAMRRSVEAAETSPDRPVPSSAATAPALSERKTKTRVARRQHVAPSTVEAFKAHMEHASSQRRLFRARGGFGEYLDSEEPAAVAHGSGMDKHDPDMTADQENAGRPRSKMMLLENGPTMARPGDEVWVLAGLSVPAILRPVPGPMEAGRPPTRKRYEFVGEAYVHDGMHGELLWEDRGDFKLGRDIARILLV